MAILLNIPDNATTDLPWRCAVVQRHTLVAASTAKARVASQTVTHARDRVADLACNPVLVAVTFQTATTGDVVDVIIYGKHSNRFSYTYIYIYLY